MSKTIKENDFLNMSFTKSSEEIKKEILEPKKEKKEKYNLMFSVDEVLVDYFKETKFLTQKNYKDYINSLIRKDMIERIGANENCTDDELVAKWEDYKKKLHELFRQASK